MEILEKSKTRDSISVENINVLYFDLKTAQDLANVSNQTLYTYASDTTKSISMVKFKGKNYLHKDDIEYIKKEVEASKSIRNVAAVTIKSNDESKELEEVKKQLDIEKEDNIKLKDKIEELENKLNKVNNNNIELDNQLKEKDSKIKELEESLSKSNDNKVKIDNEIQMKNNKIKELEDNLSEAKKNIEKINTELKNERQDRLNFMSEALELKEELGKLREFEKNTDNLNEIIKTLNREKDELYKNQINTLVEANNDMMNKFDKMIDTQNAFQAMLAQKEQTSQKLIEEKKTGIFKKLLGKQKDH